MKNPRCTVHVGLRCARPNYISIRTTSDKVRMRQMFHVKHGVDAPPTTCMRCDRQKRKRLRNRCFATATDINRCSVARSIEGTMVSTARSIEITKVRQFKSRVLMYSYATRGLGFLVRCATISRQLGQRSGGSPRFMINHRSSYYGAVNTCCYSNHITYTHMYVSAGVIITV